MDHETIAIIFQIHPRNETVELIVPVSITANDLISALNTGYNLGLSTGNSPDYYLTSDNPITLLKGNRKLRDFGLHNGTIIHFTGQ